MSDDPTDEIGAAINAAAGGSAASPFAGQRLTIDSHADAATADYARQASDFARQASDQVRRASEDTAQSTAQSSVFDPNTVLALADNAAEKAELAITAYQAPARRPTPSSVMSAAAPASPGRAWQSWRRG